MKNKNLLIFGDSEKETYKTVLKKFQEEGWNVINLEGYDITQREQLIKAESEIINEHGNIDALFLGAEGISLGSFEEISIDEWQRQFDYFFMGITNICYAFAPAMVKRNQGKITIFSPDYSKSNKESILNGSLSTALHAFGKCFGIEVAPNNVLVNVIWGDCCGKQDNLANMAYFLSEANTYISAQVVSVKGEGVHNG